MIQFETICAYIISDFVYSYVHRYDNHMVSCMYEIIYFEAMSVSNVDAANSCETYV